MTQPPHVAIITLLSTLDSSMPAGLPAAETQCKRGHCRATLLSLSGVLFTGLLLVAIGGERPPWRYVALRAALHAATADVGDPLQECPSVGPLPTAPHIWLWWTPPDDLQLTPAESRNWVTIV